MPKALRLSLLGLAGLTGALLIATLWYFRGVVFPDEYSFEEVQQLLTPHITVLTPQDSSKQHPAVLFFHGCGGPLDYTIPRAAQVLQQGYAAVIVDSYTGRGVDWELSCTGRELPGFQRAADVLAALEIARKHPSIDSQQLFLVGYSLGGWTILEALASGDELPDGLLDSPGHHLAGVRGLVAWYPYCGLATRYRQGWDSDIPVLMLLAGEDRTTPPQPCVEVASAQSAIGKSIAWKVYPGVDHGFDLQEDWVRVYDAAIHTKAMNRQTEFLTQHTKPADSVLAAE